MRVAHERRAAGLDGTEGLGSKTAARASRWLTCSYFESAAARASGSIPILLPVADRRQVGAVGRPRHRWKARDELLLRSADGEVVRGRRSRPELDGSARGKSPSVGEIPRAPRHLEHPLLELHLTRVLARKSRQIRTCRYFLRDGRVRRLERERHCLNSGARALVTHACISLWRYQLKVCSEHGEARSRIARPG